MCTSDEFGWRIVVPVIDSENPVYERSSEASHVSTFGTSIIVRAVGSFGFLWSSAWLGARVDLSGISGCLGFLLAGVVGLDHDRRARNRPVGDAPRFQVRWRGWCPRW
jgi:hypothetical protein